MSTSIVRDDRGMTLVEIIVATMILFVGVTAIMGLMASTTQMSVLSKQGNVTINAVNSFIEVVRAMPYDEIGLVGGDPEGSLESSMTLYPSGALEIHLTIDVEWINDPSISGGANYKRLNVAAVSSGPGVRPYRYVTETIVRDASGNRPDDADPPLVAYGALAPQADSVVSGLVDIDWTASTPMPNGLLTKAYLLGGGQFLLGVSGGVQVEEGWGAEWPINATSGLGTFRWDTTMTRLDAYGNTVPRYPDGPFVIQVQAWDNLVQSSSRTRLVYIDNFDPSAVASVTADPVTATTARITWTEASDGDGFAASYRVQFLRQTPGVEQALPSQWEQIPGYETATTNLFDQMTTPFSRYLASVQAISYGGRESSWTPFDDLDVTAPYVSRSRLSGIHTTTISGAGANRTATTDVTLELTPPSFAYQELVNELYIASNSAMTGKTLVASGAGFSYTHRPNDSVNVHRDPVPLHYYQVRTTLRPLGYPAGTGNEVIEVWSNVIGPNGTSGTGPMPEVW